jgi:hypothetical protein
MNNGKEMAMKCLDTLYNATGQSPVDKTMYNQLKKFLENSNIPNIKETKEYQDMERQWFLENQLCRIYKARLNKINNIITGRYDD